MKIVIYLCSLVVTIVCIAIAIEFGLERFLPDSYRGYLIVENDEDVKWTLGPFQPSQPATGFNNSVKLKKPGDTIRIVSLGASGTEGWLTAKTVFNKYGQPWEPKKLSSYSKAIEFSMNEISTPSSKKVEVINLGVAAYNITDVIRMLKDALQLDPDLLIVQIGGNETWTEGRSNWSEYISENIPYFYSELSYEIFSETKASWETLGTGTDAFNPMALFESKPQPVVMEPPGRTAGLEPRQERYKNELDRLGNFLKEQQIPVLFLIPSQNIADYQPFGSMAKSGTSEEQLEKLNEMLIAALGETGPAAKEQFLSIVELDDGIAEVNFQLGKIYLSEGDIVTAREHFWKANDRDLVLKRLPSAFHDISRNVVEQYAFSYLDVMRFYESKSPTSVVGYNWLDDDVHPSRIGQFDLATEIVATIVSTGLLQAVDYSGDLQKLPTFADYNRWTGFDDEAEGSIAYLKAAHNFLTFGRFRQRLKWDPHPDKFLPPILEDLDVANAYAPSDQSREMSIILNMLLGQYENAEQIIGTMGCNTSAERSSQVFGGTLWVANTIFGRTKPALRQDLIGLLTAEGCSK